MSPNINSFVGDLVEMARAMEELPDVKAKLTSANSFIDDLAKTVQERELRIIELKAEIDRQAHAITTLEVARDDAELRFLEVEDASSKVTNSLRAMAASMGSCIDMLDPPKPQPAALPYTDTATAELAEGRDEPVSWDQFEPRAYIDSANWTEGNVQQDPTAVSTNINNSSGTEAIGASVSIAESKLTDPGQSEADPTATVENGEPQSALCEPALMPSDAASNPSPGPYFGKRYRDVPGYIALSDWLDGGGTKEDYYPRAS